MSFVGGIKRRKVFQVAAVYLDSGLVCHAGSPRLFNSGDPNS
jgi:hypothetical protein